VGRKHRSLLLICCYCQASRGSAHQRHPVLLSTPTTISAGLAEPPPLPVLLSVTDGLLDDSLMRSAVEV
jgi:hypothetical protein